MLTWLNLFGITLEKSKYRVDLLPICIHEIYISESAILKFKFITLGKILLVISINDLSYSPSCFSIFK